MRRLQQPWIDVVAVVVLTVSAVAIVLECHRREVSPDTLALGAMAVLLFIGLGRPWHFRDSWSRGDARALAIASLGLLVGLATDLLLPISIAWTAMLWAWLSGRLVDHDRPRIFRLLLLTLFVFPWVDVDVKGIGWAMRVTSAIVSQIVLDACGLDTVRKGTMLLVDGCPVEITDHCSGEQTLHAMLVIGLATAFVHSNGRRVWPWLPVLCGFAWLANTLRVLLICVAAASGAKGAAFVWIHDVGGWLVIGIMMLLCVACFAGWQRLRTSMQSLLRTSDRGWKSTLREGYQTGRLGQIALFGLLLGCIGMGLLWRTFPLPDAGQRLSLLPAGIDDSTCPDVTLSDSEQRRLGAAKGVKRLYQCGGRRFLVTAIDGSANRRAVHDPMYCWTITKMSDQPLEGGSGSVMQVVDAGVEKEILFWFSDGVRRHASQARYLLQTSLRRVSLGWSGDEPILVLVEPVEAHPVNWFRVLDELPWLMEL